MTSFDTRAVQTGQAPDPVSGAVVPPLTLAATFVQDGVGRPRQPGGYDYARTATPNRDAYQAALADLEGGAAALAFPSGLSAEDTLLRVLTRPGDTILYPTDAYGGTGRLLRWVASAEGRTAQRVDTADLDAVAAALAAGPVRLLWLETPSNPRLELADIAAAAALAHQAGAWLVVDNTFATPVFQRPLDLGADVVVHSTTKYIGGHSDLIGGALVTAAGLTLPWTGLSGGRDVAAELAWWQNATGAVPGAFDCWLAHRGLRTLPVRVRAASASTQQIAGALAGWPDVVQVHYPGLPSHPGHDLAVRQMSGFGAVVSVDFPSPAFARAVCESVQLFRLAMSLGAVESLIELPEAMTHHALAGTDAASPGNLVRLAIGLEDPDDLLADLEQAIARARSICGCPGPGGECPSAAAAA